MTTAMESFEDMQSRHRREQKDLQSRVTQKRMSATKKTRKGVNSECEELERQLKEKQSQEIAALNGESADLEEVLDSGENTNHDEEDGLSSVTERLDVATMAEPRPEPEPPEDGRPKKRNRQKERLARRAAEQQAAIEEAKKEAANQPDEKAAERKKLLDQFSAKGLVEKSIRPDGHCLFSAVADQLLQAGISLGPDSEDMKEGESYKVTRMAAANYMERHPDDFVAWLDEPLGQYVEKIRNTAEWGGHLELLALAKNYNVEICVLQDGAQQNIEGGRKDSEKIWLAYYRHGFGLGEHYNSLRKLL
ncbi:unnamed protein product [Diplocarpon coronariae]|uniref:Otu domain-containing protein 6b n=1 Tax=Diplocarpon coronariae TaxID=2795749 RepID=A0A218Z5P9_9HELO|nr:hypothetical protein JHW43_008784 [Diplocarpon mali]OWP02575.1 otu domain-containing protein 6b [Marssonina coronariae]